MRGRKAYPDRMHGYAVTGPPTCTQWISGVEFLRFLEELMPAKTKNKQPVRAGGDQRRMSSQKVIIVVLSIIIILAMLLSYLALV